MELKELLETGVYQLASYLDCGSPDSTESPGADLLRNIRDAVETVINEVKGGRDEDEAITEASESTVSLYTHDQWATFTDLMLYQSDFDNFIGRSLAELAGSVLYEFAEESVRILLEMVKEGKE